MVARRRQFHSAGARRRTGWEEGPGGLASQSSLTASGDLIIGAGAAATQDGLTLVRTRGIVQLVQASASATNEGFFGAVGICIVSSDAFAIGVTAIPKPLDDMLWDGWLWHQFFDLRIAGAFTAANSNNAITLPIDSKAMRKFGENDTIVMVGDFTEQGTATLHVAADTRLLLKLP